MSTWLDKPDGDGLWWYQVSRGMFLIAVRNGLTRDVMDSTGKPNVEAPQGDVRYFESGKWLRCELTRPEPYKPPVPPKVEWFVAANGKRFIVQTEREWIAFDSYGYACNTGGGKCSEYYSDIKPLEAPP